VAYCCREQVVHHARESLMYCSPRTDIIFILLTALLLAGCDSTAGTQVVPDPKEATVMEKQTSTSTPKKTLSPTAQSLTLTNTPIITHTIELTLTPAQNVKGEGVYSYLHQVGYLFYYLVDPFRIIVLDEYDVGNGENIFRDISLNGPGDAQDLVFVGVSFFL
jgi:hypothetical protein